MSEKNEKKIVVVTGANKGIGFETSRSLATAGHVVWMGARDPERGRAAVNALGSDGLDVRHLTLDVTDVASVRAAAVTVANEHDHVDLLVNNAAVALDTLRDPERLPIEDLRHMYETNVIGVVAVINAFLPLLRCSPAAHIGNLTSGLGTVDYLQNPDGPFGGRIGEYANLLGYNSSKASLNAVTLVYAHLLRPEGIRVNGLSPGFVATDLNNHTGWIPASEGGANIARQILDDSDTTGAFLSEAGGTYPW